jgi:signal peptidase II
MRPRDLVLLSTLLVTSVGCDQLSKQAAIRWLSDAPTTSYLGDLFRLSYIENRGAFLGLGATWPEPVRWLVFLAFSGLLVGAAFSFALNRLRAGAEASDRAARLRFWASVLGPGLVVAGGVGNLIDRALRDGAVVDFMNLGIGSLRTGIFNVADLAILAGIGVLLVIGQQQEKRAKLAAATAAAGASKSAPQG